MGKFDGMLFCTDYDDTFTCWSSRPWGVRVLGSCDEHAVAQAIEILDSIY